ncbi:hypothetical protein RJ641_019866 [Dillenia turbinata]|uniref:Uncharacterized protein n=1 Tax=Dillenia turbinata TaxID=194707 RepID=A0AAN8UL26_9MAGN
MPVFMLHNLKFGWQKIADNLCLRTLGFILEKDGMLKKGKKLLPSDITPVGMLNIADYKMALKPTVALRAILVGGIAAFAKIAGAMKAAGGVKMGAAAAAMTAAATAAISSTVLYN